MRISLSDLACMFLYEKKTTVTERYLKFDWRWLSFNAMQVKVIHNQGNVSVKINFFDMMIFFTIKFDII